MNSRRPNNLLRYVVILALSQFLAACSEPVNLLERIKQDGVLYVATRNSATTYYEAADGKSGLEYDLASRFARELGVELKLITPSNLADIISMVSRGEVHFAAAGLTVTESRQHWVRFAPPYQQITQQLVYRMGNKRPRNLSDVQGKHLEVVANSSHVEQLEDLQAAYPGLQWVENAESDSDELLNLVWEQVIDFSVADSNEVALNRRFYPELKVAFDISEAQPVAWAFPKSVDDSLYNAASDFIKRMKDSGQLDILIARYYGHIKKFNYVGTRTYIKHIHKRLPEYQSLFEAAASQHELDWRLLAAIGYQESHWDPGARSPTGVRGIMMLTLPTAEYLEVDNRLDPAQSIAGGAKYLADLIRRVPVQIKEPDRTWFALAAYNVGLGHLEDARVITEIRGRNPDVWTDVKDSLPLLSRRKWYQKTRYGYARGREPVHYVENIRSYYDILTWFTEQDKNVIPYPRLQNNILENTLPPAL
ncbi:membrane-bound lytic murein transglycosylase MltF [Sulfuriflexus sp.]|uniref:membrane-bound lytic murein transglycosylase MltF n=1 Tax=Sulfuriflexus sp. TaxID=2015443 RepID=UPI0028CFA382|nr:membrane-bound lytic murein transglycosylase MltF [Sulfuriflexus sp.]MDT8404679.1 membrane-bound lytic murein transglycosylase MltF [Sulfuriflexus sp.]